MGWTRSDNLPANLAFFYLAISALWIIGSDSLVRWLQLPALAHTAKGWIFVAVTGALLFRTLRVWQHHRLSAEQALAESENRLRQIADNLQEVFWLTDPAKQEILFVSCGYERIWGRSCQFLYQNPQSWLGAIVDEDRQRVCDALPLQALGTYDMTYRIRTEQGQLRWIRDRAFPISDEAGKIVRIAGVASDITKERETAQALMDSEDSYRCLVELSPEGVATQIEGQLTFVNPAMVKLFAASRREDLVGRGMLELVHPDHREQAGQGMAEVMDGEAILTPRSRHLQRLDGTDFHGEILAAPFGRGGKRGALVLVRDVSERIQITSALEQHRSHLQAIIHNSSDCIVAVDHHERVLWLNPAAEKCFGYTSALACGRPWKHLFETEGIGIRSNGERFPVEFSESVVELTVGTVKTVVLRDLSERLRAEEQRKELELQLRQSQKMEALGLLAGGVAHDFNNLLTVILGAASIVHPGRPEDEENLLAIRQASQRAAGLTRQLLTFCRKQMVKLEVLDVNEVFNNITGMVRRVLGEQINLTTEFAPNLPQVRADAGMLEQVLINLVVNSRDAVGKCGSVSISTSEVLLAKKLEGDFLNALPGRYVCLEVADNGSGIDPRDLPHICDPFFTTKEVGKGTGLGLATIHGIIEQHEGGLQVLSQPGQGTRIRAFFPALSSPKAGRPRSAELHLAQGSGKVLVAEDDLALQLLIRRILTRCGYEVVGAANGLEALDLWREQSQSFDFLITDLVMPGGLSGLELGRQLQAEKSDLKVVYSSGYSTELLDTRTGLTAGERFLPKPYTPVQLAQALQDCASQRA